MTEQLLCPRSLPGWGSVQHAWRHANSLGQGCGRAGAAEVASEAMYTPVCWPARCPSRSKEASREPPGRAVSLGGLPLVSGGWQIQSSAALRSPMRLHAVASHVGQERQGSRR